MNANASQDGTQHTNFVAMCLGMSDERAFGGSSIEEALNELYVWAAMEHECGDLDIGAHAIDVWPDAVWCTGEILEETQECRCGTFHENEETMTLIGRGPRLPPTHTLVVDLDNVTVQP